MSEMYNNPITTIIKTVLKNAKMITDNVRRPFSDAAFYHMADAMYARKDYIGAIHILTSIIKGMPEAEAYFKRGTIHAYLGNYSEAVKDFNEAIKLKPTFTLAYFHRGMVKVFLNENYRDAILDFNRTLQLNPDLAEAYFYRGVAKQCLYNAAAALIDFNKAIALDPRPDFITARAEAYHALKRSSSYCELSEHKSHRRSVIPKTATTDAKSSPCHQLTAFASRFFGNFSSNSKLVQLIDNTLNLLEDLGPFPGFEKYCAQLKAYKKLTSPSDEAFIKVKSIRDMLQTLLVAPFQPKY